MDAESLLNQIKEAFPEMTITKKSLQVPSSNLVMDFNKHFLATFEEKVLYALGTSVDAINTKELDDHELFKKISKLMNRCCSRFTKFLLGDIYQPNPVRTRGFFKVCLHFLSFSGQIAEEIEQLGNSIFRLKEDGASYLNELEDLLSSIDANAGQKGQLLEDIEQLITEIKNVEILYDEAKIEKCNQEKKCMESSKQIEYLKNQVQAEQYDLDKLEDREKKLISQSITDSEYNNLLQQVEALQNELSVLSESENHLDDIHSMENQLWEYHRTCMQKVPEISEFNINRVRNILSCEDHLCNLDITVEKLYNTKLNPSKQLLSQEEEKLHKLLDSYQEIQNQHDLIIKKCTQENMNLTEQQCAFANNLEAKKLAIEDLDKELALIKEEIATFKDVSTQVYNGVLEAEDSCFKKLSNVLNEL